MIERLKKKIKEGGSYFASPKTDINWISSGSCLLNLGLGSGGWAENRIANIVGDRSSGKTLLAIEASANFAIKYPKGKIRYCETESAFSTDYAAALGMPIERVDFGEPIETVEELFKDISKYTQNSNEQPTLYIVDSLDALSDAAELGRGFDEGSYGTGKAKQMSKLFRLITGDIEKSNTSLIIISQVRTNLNAMFGDKTTRSGGRALDFYASQIVYLSEIGKIYKTVSKIKRVTGVKVKAKIKKCKVGLPFREVEFNIEFGYGVSDVESCLNYLRDTKAPVDFGADYLKQLNKMNDKDYFAAIDKIHKATETAWWKTEQSILPQRKKYDNRRETASSTTSEG